MHGGKNKSANDFKVGGARKLNVPYSLHNIFFLYISSHSQLNIVTSTYAILIACHCCRCHVAPWA
jgi:hypothetical protein